MNELKTYLQTPTNHGSSKWVIVASTYSHVLHQGPYATGAALFQHRKTCVPLRKATAFLPSASALVDTPQCLQILYPDTAWKLNMMVSKGPKGFFMIFLFLQRLIYLKQNESYLAKMKIFHREIRWFAFLSYHYSVRSCEVAVIWPELTRYIIYTYIYIWQDPFLPSFASLGEDTDGKKRRSTFIFFWHRTKKGQPLGTLQSMEKTFMFLLSDHFAWICKLCKSIYPFRVP